MEASQKAMLETAARNIRIGVIEATHAAKSGHPGGSLSIADILAYLYFAEMNIKPEDPAWEDRDRFVLSKGHCAPGLYSALANRGYFPVEELKTLRKLDSRLQGHPDMTLTWICRQVRWGWASARRQAWRSRAKSPGRATAFIRRSATARAKRARSGRRACLRHTTSWITCA